MTPDEQCQAAFEKWADNYKTYSWFDNLTKKANFQIFSAGWLAHAQNTPDDKINNAFPLNAQQR